MGKYFKYAIGEILLVVIGILLALQINNWNEDRKTQKKNAVIIQNLNNEFSENLRILQSDIEKFDQFLVAMDSLLRMMSQEKIAISQPDFELLLEKTFATPKWSPSSFVLEELKNSGALTDLDNNQLKKLLFTWERDFSLMKKHERNYDKNAEKYIEFIAKYGSVRNLDALSGNIPGLEKSRIAENPLSFLTNPEFENRLEDFYFLTYILKKSYQDLSGLMQDIITITDSSNMLI